MDGLISGYLRRRETLARCRCRAIRSLTKQPSIWKWRAPNFHARNLIVLAYEDLKTNERKEDIGNRNSPRPLSWKVGSYRFDVSIALKSRWLGWASWAMGQPSLILEIVHLICLNIWDHLYFLFGWRGKGERDKNYYLIFF
jgi:hypothetical protein